MATTQQPGAQVVRTVGDTNVPVLIATHAMARAYIEPLLPQGVTLVQVGAQVRLALEKDRAAWRKPGLSPLQQCSVGSVILAVAKACGQNLVIGETAHLVPFGTECTMLRDYTGDIQLAVASGMVKRVSAFPIYEHETFEIVRGSQTSVIHKPIQHQASRGELVGVYAMVYFRGGYDFEVEHMTYKEVDAIRQAHSKQWKQGTVPVWYMKKTCIRQSLKLIPKSPKLVALLSQLDQEGGVDAEGLDAAIAAAPDVPALAAGERERVEHTGPKAITDGGYGNEIDATNWAEVEETSGELALGEERSAPRRRTSMDAET